MKKKKLINADEIISTRKRLMVDFPFYASSCLKIRTKQGNISPFVLNSAQIFLHKQITNQINNKGNVRALVLKGRQQGISTYAEARFFWKVTHKFGVRAFILTHDQEATNNLFEMVTRMYNNCPESMKPDFDKQNAKELYFRALDSGYKVGTAGNRATGRSSTLQFFHGSEVAYWPHAHDHAKGILQSIADLNETEIILESTANGTDNYFYEQWQRSENNKSDFIPIFIPWFWQKEYQRELIEGFTATSEEKNLAKFFHLTNEQLCWRRLKIQELSSSGKDGELAFQQEYPCTPIEAFTVSTTDTLIKMDSVLCAQKIDNINESGAKILGVDIARFGNDFTIFVRRCGRKAYNIEKFSNFDGNSIASFIYERFQKEKFDFICLDIIGVGASVYDALKARMNSSDFTKIVKAVNAAETKSLLYPSKYANKRAEMWSLMNQWLTGDVPVSLPEDSELLSQLCSQRYDYKAHGKMILQSKKNDSLPSPDKADALALTFSISHEKANNVSTDAIKKLSAYNKSGYSNNSLNFMNGIAGH